MPELSRRTLFLGGAAVAAGGAILMNKPHDHSGPRDPYFLSVQAALLGAGIAWPTLVIDRKRLSDNVRTLKTHLPAGMGYRIVAKSLPSIGLLSHIRDLSGTDRLMTFNQPMLSQLSVDMPHASQLVGKPLPVRAARHYFETLPADASAAADNIEWLIDTPERLQQYAALASDIGRPLKIVLELDVGLHRGGFEPGPALGATIESIEADPNLEFKGFMGYEPHIPSLPTALGWRASGSGRRSAHPETVAADRAGAAGCSCPCTGSAGRRGPAAVCECAERRNCRSGLAGRRQPGAGRRSGHAAAGKSASTTARRRPPG